MVVLSYSRNKHVRFSSRRVKWRQVLARKEMQRTRTQLSLATDIVGISWYNIEVTYK